MKNIWNAMRHNPYLMAMVIVGTVGFFFLFVMALLNTDW